MVRVSTVAIPIGIVAGIAGLIPIPGVAFLVVLLIVIAGVIGRWLGY